MIWRSIRSKYERMQEITVESYPKTNEESKDLPRLKDCNCIVFFTAYASSFFKNLFRIVFTLAELYKKSLRGRYHFVTYHLEERSVSNAIPYQF